MSSVLSVAGAVYTGIRIVPVSPLTGRTSLLTASPDVLKRSSCKHKIGVAVHSAYLALVWEHHPSTDCCRQIVLPALSCMGNGVSSGPVSSVMTPSGE